jgi:hypothetical protein
MLHAAAANLLCLGIASLMLGTCQRASQGEEKEETNCDYKDGFSSHDTLLERPCSEIRLSRQNPAQQCCIKLN